MREEEGMMLRESFVQFAEMMEAKQSILAWLTDGAYYDALRYMPSACGAGRECLVPNLMFRLTGAGVLA